jgi:hypothetical protein
MPRKRTSHHYRRPNRRPNPKIRRKADPSHRQPASQRNGSQYGTE